ncbi:MAG: DUF1365 domain-containing protein [Nitriliruptoraceae bacterium]
MTLASGLCVGWVRHRRRRPRPHAFRVRSYHALLRLDELDRLDRTVTGFGVNRAAIASFHDRDHFDDTARPVRVKLAERLDQAGVAMPDGPIEVLTNLRVAGYVFNPISWWYCWHADGRLGVVVAEVHNTFGDQHSYVLDDLSVDGPVVRARARKHLHVSPFLPIAALEYRFTLTVTTRRRFAHIDVVDADGVVLDATQDGWRRDFDTGNLWRVLVSRPLMPLRTIVLIHAHALALWWKRTPFHQRPAPDGHRRSAAETEARS